MPMISAEDREYDGISRNARRFAREFGRAPGGRDIGSAVNEMVEQNRDDRMLWVRSADQLSNSIKVFNSNIVSDTPELQETVFKMWRSFRNYVDYQKVQQKTELTIWERAEEHLFALRSVLAEISLSIFQKIFKPIREFWGKWISRRKSDGEIQIDRLTSIKSILIDYFQVAKERYETSNKVYKMFGSALNFTIGGLWRLSKATNNWMMGKLFGKKEKVEEPERLSTILGSESVRRQNTVGYNVNIIKLILLKLSRLSEDSLQLEWESLQFEKQRELASQRNFDPTDSPKSLLSSLLTPFTLLKNLFGSFKFKLGNTRIFRLMEKLFGPIGSKMASFLGKTRFGKAVFGAVDRIKGVFSLISRKI